MNFVARRGGSLTSGLLHARTSKIRCLHQTRNRNAISHLQMPAMSPTMTEGGISSWKKREGEAFVAGDVLLEIETDKATIDVEAQDDGVMGKIVTPDGTKNVAVGKIIALLAEEGDDISNLEAPKEVEHKPPPPKEELSPPPPPEPQPESSSSPKPIQPSSHPASLAHTRPLFPSVNRLLLEHASSIPSATDIKGTGIRGMLTKGDVLAFLGRASGPLGSYEGKEVKTEMKTGIKTTTKDGLNGKAEKIKPMDGPALRRLIVSNMLQSSLEARNASAPTSPATFDSIIADYLPAPPARKPKSAAVPPTKSTVDAYFDGLI